MITFKHFLDRPSWAAAAGYDFNIIDSMSYAAQWPNICSGCWDVMADIPGIELGEAWWKLPLSLLIVIIAVLYPMFFWAFGLAVWIKCRRHREKYLKSTDEREQMRLNNWLEEFDRRHRHD